MILADGKERRNASIHGGSNKEIADDLSISPVTVKTHVSNLLGKLQLLDRTQAAIFAIRHGVVAEE